MGRESTKASSKSRVRANISDSVTNKLLNKLQGEAKKYAEAALKNPSKRDEFEYGSHHGYIKALGHAEQWLQELLEEEEDDENE